MEMAQRTPNSGLSICVRACACLCVRFISIPNSACRCLTERSQTTKNMGNAVRECNICPSFQTLSGIWDTREQRLIQCQTNKKKMQTNGKIEICVCVAREWAGERTNVDKRIAVQGSNRWIHAHANGMHRSFFFPGRLVFFILFFVWIISSSSIHIPIAMEYGESIFVQCNNQNK